MVGHGFEIRWSIGFVLLKKQQVGLPLLCLDSHDTERILCIVIRCLDGEGWRPHLPSSATFTNQGQSR